MYVGAGAVCPAGPPDDVCGGGGSVSDGTPLTMSVGAGAVFQTGPPDDVCGGGGSFSDGTT